MIPQLVNTPEIKLVGMKLTMTLTNFQMAKLWQNFMPNLGIIPNKLGSDLYSIAEYAPDHFTQFNPNREFIRWACVPVSDFKAIPPSMDSLLIPAGTYAVFHYKGLSTDSSIFRYIYQTWLPSSNFKLGQGPHFEVLGDKYQNNHPDSEEDIWIPVQTR